MDKNKFKTILERHLMPLVQGAKLSESDKKGIRRRKPVTFIDPQKIEIKPRKEETYAFIIHRQQHFQEKGTANSEIKLIEAFVEELNLIEDALGKTFEEEVLESIIKKTLANVCSTDSEQKRVILNSINQFEKWSSELYEGQPITWSIGIFNSEKDSEHAINILDLWKTPWAPVISNGADTLISVDKKGKILSFETPEMETVNNQYAPYRFAPLANWSKTNGICLTLNRNGEIIIFKNGELLFVKRSTKWHFLRHEATIKQISYPRDPELRKSIYLSCLDASFSRKGACIGVMKKGEPIEEIVPKEDDRMSSTSIKRKIIHSLLQRKKFPELDRRLRLDLLSTDGATVLDYKGEILATGAILKIEGGSEGGGRLAAAKELAKFGTGIKISQDGTIVAFTMDKDESREVARIM